MKSQSEVKKELITENKKLKSSLDYIALVASSQNLHLGRPRTSDNKCIFCLAYFALNDGAYGESFDYETMAKEMRKKLSIKNTNDQ